MQFSKGPALLPRVGYLSGTPYKALIPVTPTTPWIKILAAKPQVPHEMAFEGRAEEQQWRLPPATELTQNILKQQSVLDISKRRRTSILGHMVPMLLDDATEAIQFTQQTTSHAKLQGICNCANSCPRPNGRVRAEDPLSDSLFLRWM